MYHGHSLAMTGAAGAALPFSLGYVWVGIAVITLFFAGLAITRLLPHSQR